MYMHTHICEPGGRDVGGGHAHPAWLRQPDLRQRRVVRLIYTSLSLSIYIYIHICMCTSIYLSIGRAPAATPRTTSRSAPIASVIVKCYQYYHYYYHYMCYYDHYCHM